MQALRPEEPRPLRQFGAAIITSLISIAIVIGGLSLALSENSPPLFPDPYESTPDSGAVPTGVSTATPGVLAPTVAPTEPGIVIASPTFPPVASPLPTQTGTTATTSTCGPPFGWVKTYIVQPGDTLFRIAFNHYTTTSALQQANCKGSSTNINPGEKLWVPNVATRTPGVTVIPDFPSSTPVPTDPLTETPLPFTASPSPTNTNVPATQTPLPTVTPVTPNP